MLVLAYPWVLVALCLPFVARMVLPVYRKAQDALVVPWFVRVTERVGANASRDADVVEATISQRTLIWVLWAVVVLSLARPQYLEPPISKTTPTRDLLLLVDLSGSMDTEDFTDPDGQKVDRLTAVKSVIDEFLERREGDRVGLVVFGNAAFVQVPFTQDLSVSRVLLDETAVGMAGPRTALGDAIGLGITLFSRSDVTNRVMIALTDGNDTASKVPLSEAAKIATDNNIVIHMIGVGDPEAAGEEKLDEDALNAVSSQTGGSYYHADNRAELEEIYVELDRLDSREIESISYRPRKDLFQWPLAAFFVLGMISHGIAIWRQESRELS